MLLWIGFAVMTAGVLALLLRPLLQSGGPAESASAGSVAVYRDQLAEVELERERGLIGGAEAEAARVEIARRLLASAETPPASMPSHSIAAATQFGGRVALAVGAVLPTAAIVIYLAAGAPGLPQQSKSQRLTAPTTNADVAPLVAAVEARLRQHPEDGEGWDVIAPVYLRQERFREAVDAFDRAIRLRGESAKRLAGLAEAGVMASDGIVTEQSRIAYEKFAKLEPGRVEPRFWLALAKEQDGQLAMAEADYQALLHDGERDAPWRPAVVERLDAVRARLGGPRVPAAIAKSATAKTAPDERGPSPQDIATAERLPADDRQRMIEDMVQGLADRLAKDARDLAGWQRLIRAYSVMGRTADATSALAQARATFAAEPQSLTTLGDLARALGLGT